MAAGVATGELDQHRLDVLVDSFATAVAGALQLVTVLVGDRLGLYRAMADGRPVTPAELADRTGTADPHAVRWLEAQAAAGYLDHDPQRGWYRMSPEQAAVLVGDIDGVSVAGASLVVAAAFRDEPLVTESFRTGAVPAGRDHHPDLAAGLARLRLRLPGAAAACVFIDHEA